MDNNKKISLIIPVYNEGEHIKQSLQVIHNQVKELGIAYEIIIIDDGSRDNTYETLMQIKGVDFLKVIKLSRNFGKEAALCAGLDIVESDACVIMDADLQHPPYLIEKMVELWREGYDVVECIKTSRGKESLHNKIGSRLFYGLLKRFSGFDLNGASDFKLLDNKVVKSWKEMKERNTFFRGMSLWLGYKRTQIPFQVADRVGGETHWSIASLVKLALTAITSFSTVPLHIITFLGLMFLCGSVILGIQTLLYKFIGKAVDGFSTVILLLLIVGSLVMISLGIIGQYVAKIYEEVKFRPRYIIESVSRIDNKFPDFVESKEKIEGREYAEYYNKAVSKI